jgi:hypothetical protein
MDAKIHVRDIMRLLGRDWPIGFHDKFYMTRSGYYTPTPEQPDSWTLNLQVVAAEERKRA